MKQWIVYNKKGDFNGIAKRYGIDPVTARCLVNRGIAEEEMGTYLNPKEGKLYDPRRLKGALRAAEIVKSAITDGKKIRIIGDYDADGIFSTYILKKCIQTVGGNVDYDIPHRMKDGYGLNERLF